MVYWRLSLVNQGGEKAVEGPYIANTNQRSMKYCDSGFVDEHEKKLIVYGLYTERSFYSLCSIPSIVSCFRPIPLEFMMTTLIMDIHISVYHDTFIVDPLC